MANLVGLFGFNPSNGNDALIAAHGNDLVNVSTNTSYNQFLTSNNNVEFETFLDKCWAVNGVDPSRYFDGVTWVKTGSATRFPLPLYIKKYHGRLYIANLKIINQNFPSRVWFSNIPNTNQITWDYETTNNLQQSAGSNIVTAPGATFSQNGLIAGDPLIIVTGPNQGTYRIASVVSDTQLTLTKNLAVSDPADTFWVGGNWFDVATDDNDVITGFGENSDRLLIFKRNSLYRWDDTALRKVKGVPGTTSGRSIANVRQWTFYFYRNGIYRYDGVTSSLISRAVQEYLDGVPSTNYNSIVAWRLPQNEEIYRCFIGNVNNTTTGLVLNNCFLDYDTATQTWSPGAYPNPNPDKPLNVVAATEFIENQARNVYIGSSNSQVFQDNIGNTDGSATTPIQWYMETPYIFPFGSDIEGKWTRVQVYTRNGRGCNFAYKLYGTPGELDKQWTVLGNLDNYITEFKFKTNLRDSSRGIKFLVSDSDVLKSPVIEKIIVFGKPKTARYIK